MAWSVLCSQSHSLSIVVLTFIFSFRLRVFMCQTILSEAAVCTGCPEVGYICLNKLFDVTDSFIWHLAISYTSKNFRWPDSFRSGIYPCPTAWTSSSARICPRPTTGTSSADGYLCPTTVTKSATEDCIVSTYSDDVVEHNESPIVGSVANFHSTPRSEMQQRLQYVTRMQQAMASILGALAPVSAKTSFRCLTPRTGLKL